VSALHRNFGSLPGFLIGTRLEPGVYGTRGKQSRFNGFAFSPEQKRLKPFRRDCRKSPVETGC
jgi:hypothetical protein